MTQEIWEPVKNYEKLYEVSNTGKVKSLERIDSNNHPIKERILKNNLTTAKYNFVRLYKNGNGKNYSVHRLVAKTFIPNPENKPQINHKDGIKTHNHDSNLEWCSSKENKIHASKNGLVACGENNFKSKLSIESVLLIREECLKYSVPILSKEFNIDEITIWRIIKGESWKSIPYPEKENNLKFLMSDEFNKIKSSQRKGIKLNIDKVRKIKQLKGVKKQKEIARLFNVDLSTIKHIHCGLLWRGAA